VVLAQMAKGNIITEKKRETSKFTITLDFKLESHREGSATYFREYLRDYMKNGLMKTRSPTDL
jgi:penicillin-binding protein 1A